MKPLINDTFIFSKDPLDGVAMATLKSENMLECNLCPKSFLTKAHLTDHLKRHIGDKQFPCSECDAAFITKGGLNNHIITHRRKDGNTEDMQKFPCVQCGSVFFTQSLLKAHNKIHEGNMDFECNICGKQFLLKGGWNYGNAGAGDIFIFKAVPRHTIMLNH